MKLNIKSFLVIAVSALLFSCEEDGYADYDPGQTNVQELSGEWFIAGYAPDGTVNHDYYLWSTYNTAQNNDSLWIDDHGTYYELKTKVEADVEELTFSGQENAIEQITGGTVTISNGKIIKDGGRAYSSGAVVDSIYFEAEFDWDPGVIYTFGGHERTGFEEDEHPSVQ